MRADELLAARSTNVTVQLLIHGATYNRSYWDLPGTSNGVTYSYARDMAAAGFTTFVIDQIGAGQSTMDPAGSTIPSAGISIDVAAYVDHNAVLGLKGSAAAPPITGDSALPRFGKVIEVGHSGGSLRRGTRQSPTATSMESSSPERCITLPRRARPPSRRATIPRWRIRSSPSTQPGPGRHGVMVTREASPSHRC